MFPGVPHNDVLISEVPRKNIHPNKDGTKQGTDLIATFVHPVHILHIACPMLLYEMHTEHARQRIHVAYAVGTP